MVQQSMFSSGLEISDNNYYKMDVEDWESSSDNEFFLQDKNDDEDICYASGFQSKIQFRKDITRARWNDESKMAEVLENKGKMWVTTGIVRGGKIYCTIEETLFLTEIGALHLLDENDRCLSFREIYEKVAQEQSGCCWELFEAYRHLKSLGYVVGRHRIPWTLRATSVSNETVSHQSSPKGNGVVELDSLEKNSIIELLSKIQINETRPAFDVYLPNSKFRKSSPGDPSFVLCLIRGSPPSKAEIEALERQCGSIPLRFCHVDHGRVSLFSFDKHKKTSLHHSSTLPRICRSWFLTYQRLLPHWQSILFLSNQSQSV